MAVKMATLPESGTKRPKPTTPDKRRFCHGAISELYIFDIWNDNLRRKVKPTKLYRPCNGLQKGHETDVQSA